MIASILCYVPSSVDLLESTTPSFQTRTHYLSPSFQTQTHYLSPSFQTIKIFGYGSLLG